MEQGDVGEKKPLLDIKNYNALTMRLLNLHILDKHVTLLTFITQVQVVNL